jgi:hypothetical protein
MGGGADGWQDHGGEPLDHGEKCQGDNEGKMGKVERSVGGLRKW